jgi:3-oxoacyl-[acyl-carrier protein] reductase
MLNKKNAVIYGASQSLGGAVAREMARAGARLFVTNIHPELAQEVADQINAEGGRAEAARVDAFDAVSIQAHLDDVIKKAGTVDISFNLIGIAVKQNIPLIKMEPDDFVQPVSDAMRTHFLTATAAGRLMAKQGSGVILSLTATPGGIGVSRCWRFWTRVLFHRNVFQEPGCRARTIRGTCREYPLRGIVRFPSF